MIKKIKLIKFVLIILIPIFLWSFYQSYHLVAFNIFKQSNESKISILVNRDKIYVGEEFQVNLIFKNIPNINLSDNDIKGILAQVGACADLIEYSIFNKEIKEFGKNNVSSFSITADYKVGQPCETEKFRLLNVTNSDGILFTVNGILPQIKNYGSYEISTQPKVVYPNDEFEIVINVYHIDSKLEFSKIYFKDNSLIAPRVVSKPIVKSSPTNQGRINYTITQKFKAIGIGNFWLAGIDLKFGKNISKTKVLPIKIILLESYYDFKYELPKEIGEKLVVTVELQNVLANHIVPKFPDIQDCSKLKLRSSKEAISDRTFTYTYTQEYRVNYDGQYNPSPIQIVLNGQKSFLSIPSFTVNFDCSSIEIDRPQNGLENTHSGGRARGSEKEMTITNDNPTDIFIKVINNSNDRAIRSVYIRRNMKTTLRDLPAGTYFLACAYGSHWDKNKSRFRCNKSFSIFNRYDDLMTFKYDEVGTWEMTLYQKSSYSSYGGPQSISESKFDIY